MKPMKYVEILTLTWASKPLLYAIPQHLQDRVEEGMLVEVPFGQTSQYGIVSKIVEASATASFEIKEISKILYEYPLFAKDILELIGWISKYYAASIKSVAEAVIPTAIRKLTNPKFSTKISIARPLSEAEINILKVRSPKQYEIYSKIIEASSNRSEILKHCSPSALKALIDKDIVGEIFEPISRIDYQDKFGHDDPKKYNIKLTKEQTDAVESICSSLDGSKFKTHLLHGITGSGKTEVYIKAIDHALELGGDVIMLIPELALTPQTVGRIRNGIEISEKSSKNAKVLVWHSGLSEGERRDAWLALSNGDAKIVIGARSAIFAPLKNVKLIIVDEEHESTYKQSEAPRYHARDVAVYRAKLNNAVCVLGSATPSLESFFNAQNKKYHLNLLSNRVDGSVLPTVEVVDMRDENPRNIISAALNTLIIDRLDKREQVILFLNRRGYATIVLCKQCNYVAQCPRCSLSLTYHRDKRSMLCHLCGYEEPLPERCPICGNFDIIRRGLGSQKLEQITAEQFPMARVARIDSDTMTGKNGFKRVLSDFRQGKIDILIGTQMIAKGLDFPNISLVGIIGIDGTINFPDFRSAERAFQLIVQVSGRAGRGDKRGHVIVQTRNPQSYVIQLAKAHRFQDFISSELANRAEFMYPPYRHVIRVVLMCANEDIVKACSVELQKHMKQHCQTAEIRLPTPSILAKINEKFRYTIVIFSTKPSHDGAQIAEAMRTFKHPKSMDVVIDVDPTDLV
ncbi:MAG: primosomal protein N' [Puniceicoccales bacterium]|jgi:primosomal protein N' (replication factor Y)|nr:primosomal protein N' [Puniceicoccales bacterium]